MNDGSDTDQTSVTANGSGNILIDALAGSITANADILSDTGHITITAANNIEFTANVDVTTSTPGTISIDAETGTLTMDGTANVEATDSSARLNAALDVIVGNVTATNVSIVSGEDIVNAVNSTKNVTATNLRLAAVGSIGASDRHVTTNIDNVSASAANGSIYLTEDDAAIVTNVTVTVTAFNSDASSTDIIDAAQSDLSTGDNGNIVLVATLGNITLNDGSDTDNTSVSANGTGNILIDALAGSITANADIVSGTGHISLLAGTSLTLTTGTDVSTAGSGSIDFNAENGSVTLATDSDQTAENGDIRISSGADLTLGGVITTSGSVSLIATGAITDADSDDSVDVIATGLRVASAGFGTSSNAIETTIDAFAASATTGGFYLDETSALIVGTVTVAIDRVNTDASVTSIVDNSLTGAVATLSDIEITAELDLTLELVQTTTDAVLTSTTGSILDGGDLPSDVIVAGTATLSAVPGLGRTGSGDLDLEVGILDAVNTGVGSAYINLIGNAEIAGLELQGAGSLFLSQRTGDLSVTGAIEITDGRAMLTTRGALTVNADVTATDYLRTVSSTLDVNGAALTSENGDVEIRTSSDADFDATSAVNALNGLITVTAGGALTVSDFEAAEQIDLRVRGDILQSGGELKADALKIYSQDGQIGASAAAPIFTNVDRLDIHSAGEVFISETDGVEFGRSAIASGGENAGETVTINVGTGTISSVNDSVIFGGDGTLVITSTGDVTLGTSLSATNSDIVIATRTLTDGTPTEDILLEARNGRVSIIATAGVGAAGVADIDIASAEITSTSETGDVALELRASTTVVGAGITIGSGSGRLVVNQISGSLTLNGRASHYGAGFIDLDVLLGSLSMTSNGRISTVSGSMDVWVKNNFTLSQVSSTSGKITLRSQNGSIRTLSGFGSANIVSSQAASVFVDKIAEFTVNSNLVKVNGFNVYRSGGESLITIVLNFS